MMSPSPRRKPSSFFTEEQRRAGALAMLVGGWTVVQAWVIWALVVALIQERPPEPGTLPLWVVPVGIEALLFAVTGAMLRSRMRLDDTFVEVFRAGSRAQPDILRRVIRQELARAMSITPEQQSDGQNEK